MGIFDFFKRSESGTSGAAKAGPPSDRRVAGHAKVAADKRAQTYDRLEAIQALAALRSPEAATALLKRFAFSIDPSITDQEEKEAAFVGIIEAGRGADLSRDAEASAASLEALRKRRDEVVDAVVAHCDRAEQLTWPLKVLRELLPDEDYVAELVELLGKFDTEYSRNVEPKLQLIKALEHVNAPDVRPAVEPFLGDVNETVRFHAVETTFAQNDPACVPALTRLLAAEESVRVKNKVAEGLAQRGYGIPADQRAVVSAALRDAYEFTLTGDGTVVRRG